MREIQKLTASRGQLHLRIPPLRYDKTIFGSGAKYLSKMPARLLFESAKPVIALATRL